MSRPAAPRRNSGRLAEHRQARQRERREVRDLTADALDDTPIPWSGWGASPEQVDAWNEADVWRPVVDDDGFDGAGP
jgi:hypothetical protein